MSIKQYQKHIGKRRAGNNKYGAKKTYCRQKHLHDSKKEATRCDVLHVLKKSGIISRLKQQPKFILLKGFWIGHEKIRPIHYFADFSYYEDGVYVIEDVKSSPSNITDVYKLKKKLLLNKIKGRRKAKFFENYDVG